jgi:hypothetical protein
VSRIITGTKCLSCRKEKINCQKAIWPHLGYSITGQHCMTLRQFWEQFPKHDIHGWQVFHHPPVTAFAQSIFRKKIQVSVLVEQSRPLGMLTVVNNIGHGCALCLDCDDRYILTFSVVTEAVTCPCGVLGGARRRTWY